VGDISDKAKLDQVLRRADAVMHFAAHAYVANRWWNQEENISKQRLRAYLIASRADSKVRRFVFSSSSRLRVPAKVPITENSSFPGKSPTA